MGVQRATGSKNVGTLHVLGADVVPLLEGHSDTRERFSWNPFTYSDKRSFRDGGTRPTCEILFKGGPNLELELRKYVRSKGWSGWMTVATSESGSYSEAEIIAFLEAHLETTPDDRPWRVLLVDDFGPHKTNAVRRLAWQRKYVVIVHGGGATSVVQTNDTDQNQHVRREYTELESIELLKQASTLEKKIPVLSHERTLDLFAEIWQRDEIHDQARKGYLTTGVRIPLEGDDADVRREAGVFWREMHMKKKRSSELQDVADAYRAEELEWTFEHVYGLIKEYPKRGQMDDTLASQFDTFWDEDEPAHQSGDDGGNDDDDDDDGRGGGAEGGDDPGEDGHGDGAASDSFGDALFPDGGSDAEAAEIHGSHGSLDGGANDAVALLAKDAELEETHAEKMQKITLGRAMAFELKDPNLLIAFDRALAKEEKRFRAIRKESPAVVAAMERRQVQERAELVRRRLEIKELNEGKRKLADLEREKKETAARVQGVKQEMKKALRDFEDVYTSRSYSVEDLGEGKTTQQDRKKAKKNRMAVLDKLSRVGAGLSPEQMNDFAWFKESWDKANEERYGADWPAKFAEFMQGVHNSNDSGVRNAFSVFMHAETQRCLSHIPMLRV